MAKTRTNTDTDRLAQNVADIVDEKLEKARAGEIPPQVPLPPPRRRGEPATPWVTPSPVPGSPDSREAARFPVRDQRPSDKRL